MLRPGVNNLLDSQIQISGPLTPDLPFDEHDDELEQGVAELSIDDEPGFVDFSSQCSQTGQDVDFDDFSQKRRTALDLKDTFLTTGCQNIDGFLNGGILRSGLTEFAGPSGVGKTQIALQLSITAQLPEEHGGLNAGVIYINTEGPFPSQRLAQICKHFKDKYGSTLPEAPMDNILIKNAFDTVALMACVTSDLPSVLTERKVGLLIVDSIAATFRSEYDNNSISKVKDMRLIGRGLHDIAFNHNLVLVCMNQVGASMSADCTESLDFAPSLGVAWRTLVNNRIITTRKDDKRWFEVPFSCYIPVRNIAFEVSAEGIFSTDGHYVTNKR